LPRLRFEKIIKADRQHVFDIVTNYENFEKLLPQFFPSIRVRSIRENTSVVEEHLRLGQKELVMMTKHVTTPPDLHETFVIGGDAKGSHIVENFAKTQEGTKLTVDADIKLGIFFGKNKISYDYGKMIDEFAKIAES
jgi:coenzyme Q-binding protein COQ10